VNRCALIPGGTVGLGVVGLVVHAGDFTVRLES
jgi:hypothetical protein